MLEKAKVRLDLLDLYPDPVSLEGVRVLVVPWVFRLPRMRRYRGYALRKTILLAHTDSEDLITHELCHVWQMQHRSVHFTWKWLTCRYKTNPYEQEARRAVRLTAARQCVPEGIAL